MAKNTTSFNLEGALNALDKNKDGSHFAVAGRNVFKILHIDEKNKFSETLNMRVGKNLNLNFSCNDVAWSNLDQNLIATGATNGAVVTWNLNKSNRNKMDIVYQDHKRTVNKVCFHPNDSNLLLSGSQDGTMKLFDLRQNESVVTFLSQSESVRDVQFSKFNDYKFSSVQENGNVQIWNLKKPDHHEKQFTAHSGPVFSCDWHLENQNYLATAGRDKTIKVWDISEEKTQLEHCIQTIASVARIKWRPSQKTHIASSSLVVDFNIYIWDYSRPFVPFACLQEHKDVTTDFVWRDADANILISAGKDGTVYQHIIQEADQSYLKTNPCGLAMNKNGDIFLAIGDHLINDSFNTTNFNIKENKKKISSKSKDLNLSHLCNTVLESKQKNLSYQNKESISSKHNSQQALTSTSLNTSSASALMRRGIQIFQSNQPSSQNQNNNISNDKVSKQFSSSAIYFKNENVCKAISLNWFVQTALNYQLTGKPLAELFENNAKVAEKLERIQVAQTWRILKQFYVGVGQNQSLSSQFSTQNQSSVFENSTSSSINSFKNTNTVLNNSNKNQTNKISINKKNSSSDKEKLVADTKNNLNHQKRFLNDSNLFSPNQIINSENVSSTNSFNNSSINKKLKNKNDSNRNCSGDFEKSNTSKPTSLNVDITLQDSKNLQKKNDSDENVVEDLTENTLNQPLNKILAREHQDFFFGDGDVNDTNGLTTYDVDTNDILTELDDININPYEVPREAFQLRHPIQEIFNQSDIFLLNNDLNAINLSETTESFDDEHTNTIVTTNSKKFKIDNNAERLLSIEIDSNPSFKFSEIVVDMLKFYSNQGDVQTSVSILIILGEKIKTLIDLANQEHWFHSYIELLSRFQLWNTINQVIKLSVLPSINSLNQLSTTIYTSCATCNKAIKNKVSWICDKCSKVSSNCSVCHEVVKGIYVWCQGCSHGGHINHLKQWFSQNNHCPTGCGHFCEYN